MLGAPWNGHAGGWKLAKIENWGPEKKDLRLEIALQNDIGPGDDRARPSRGGGKDVASEASQLF